MKAIFFLVFLFLAGCGNQPMKPTDEKIREESLIPASAFTPVSPLKRKILALARSEWVYFGQQNVVYQEAGESIPHVGFWEDDDVAHIYRVNRYWQAVGMPWITGKDCQQPWSAAFISWVMSTAGVPEEQFPPASAHWVYLTQIISKSDRPYRSFVPRVIKEYKPQPGDLICASRGFLAIPLIHDPTQVGLLKNAKIHCDIVLERKGQTLEAIGGNVRNSVSKSILTLDQDGYLQPTPSRPWFLVIENRL
jgi:hypothetical protein